MYSQTVGTDSCTQCSLQLVIFKLKFLSSLFTSADSNRTESVLQIKHMFIFS